MAGAIGKRIVQCCDAPGYELYNTEISPPDACYDINEIRILWCSFGGDTSHPNHIVPLMKLSHGEGKWLLHVSLFLYAAEINYGQYSYNGRLYAVQYGADVQLERQLYWELKYSGNRRNKN